MNAHILAEHKSESREPAGGRCPDERRDRVAGGENRDQIHLWPKLKRNVAHLRIEYKVNIQRGHEHTRKGKKSESGIGSLRELPCIYLSAWGGVVLKIRLTYHEHTSTHARESGSRVALG